MQRFTGITGLVVGSGVLTAGSWLANVEMLSLGIIVLSGGLIILFWNDFRKKMFGLATLPLAVLAIVSQRWQLHRRRHNLKLVV